MAQIHFIHVAGTKTIRVNVVSSLENQTGELKQGGKGHIVLKYDLCADCYEPRFLFCAFRPLKNVSFC